LVFESAPCREDGGVPVALGPRGAAPTIFVWVLMDSFALYREAENQRRKSGGEKKRRKDSWWNMVFQIGRVLVGEPRPHGTTDCSAPGLPFSCCDLS